MATTLLRTLTLKSVLKFGKDYDKTVNDLLAFKENIKLAWYYFNYSNISFTEDVLMEIGIGKEFRIDKPGKDPERNNQWYLHHKSLVSLEDRLYGYTLNRNKEKAAARLAKISESRQSKKIVLRSKNQYK